MNINIDFVHKLSLAYHTECKPLCRELNFTQTAFDILMFLANNPEYKSASDIVNVRKIKANLVSVNVNRLVDMGCIERETVAGDRRKTYLICTDKAKPIIEKGKKLQASFFEKLFEHTTQQEKELFFSMIEIISKNADSIVE